MEWRKKRARDCGELREGKREGREEKKEEEKKPVLVITEHD